VHAFDCENTLRVLPFVHGRVTPKLATGRGGPDKEIVGESTLECELLIAFSFGMTF
jgi:hypothetical protein